MKENICVNIYQNPSGNILISSHFDENGQCYEAWVENAEKLKYTSELLYDDILNGFSSYDEFNPEDHDGKCEELVWVEMIEDEDYKMIAHIEVNFEYVEYYFENMDDYAKSLFIPIKQITGDVKEELEKAKPDPLQMELKF